MESLTGTAYGHTFSADRLDSGNVVITSWKLPNGADASKRYGLVGKTFTSARAAGSAVYEATHKHLGKPENVNGRYLSWTVQVQARKGKTTRDAKSSGPTKTDAPEARTPAPVPSRQPVDTSPTGTAQAAVAQVARAAKLETTFDARVHVDVSRKKIPGERRGDIRSTIQAVKDQNGVAEGYVRYWCIDCGDGFIAKPVNGVNGEEPPARCPKGHICIDLRPNSH